MQSISPYELAWQLYRAGVDPAVIGTRVGRNRATVYRWVAQIQRIGIREFVRRKQTCKVRAQPGTPTLTKHRIWQVREQRGWCGQKIQKELREKDARRLSVPTIYRVLGERFEIGSKWKKIRKRGAPPQATGPRQVVEQDTVDFGELYAYTAIDIFTKEPSVVMATDLKSQTGCRVFATHHARYGRVGVHQSDEGSEFLGRFPETIEATGARHRYARPYRKNDQAHIENFNRSLRRECLGYGHYRREELTDVQARVDAYLVHWMDERWHMGLPDMMTPARHLAWYHRQQNPAVQGKSHLR